MERSYDPSAIEAKWQQKWEEAKIYEVDLKKAKKPYYTHVMWPYPSGDKLHVGHWFNFGPADSFARFMRMKGHDVFSPMGFDAFGLPAENYAIKTGVPPAVSTGKNVKTMIEQLKRMGCMYDWSKMADSSKPEYYQWTQWLFLQMFKHGLAYKKEGSVNFCPKCQTVLANEQVKDGACERCETEVIQKELSQWYWKITQYADRLLEGLEDLNWPEKTKIMQTNWIGKKHGINITYEVEGTSLTAELIPQLTTGKRCVHLVFSPHKRSALFEETSTAIRMLQTILNVSKYHDVELHEAVAMPDHLHLLVSFDSSRHLEDDVVKKIKGATARLFSQSFSWEEGGHVWQRGKHFTDVTNAEEFRRTLAYIRENPRRANIDANGRVLSGLPQTVTCFTTRPDTNFGATFIVLAPEHPFVRKVMERKLVPTNGEDRSKHVRWYYEQSLKKTEMERQTEGRKKTGEFTGFYAVNQLTGYRMPVWVSDFVLGGFGTGAVVGVPGHDVRDFEFAQQFKIPVIRVVVAGDGDTSPIERLEQVQEEEGTMINSQFLDGLNIHEATKRIMSYMEDKGMGQIITTYRLRDWLISRQRYWGAPIPVVYDPEGKIHPIPEKYLPWLLPTDVAFKPTGKSPLTESRELKERVEKIFGKGWTPEYDTMDTFVCSSYYSFMYLGATQGGGTYRQRELKTGHPADPAIEHKWMPVQMYIGGAEHATMHLIYARFVTMALKDFGIVSHEEPYQRLVHQGTITHKGAKMSKSKGNVVSPDSFVERHGSDVFRMYLMFMGPFTEGGDWSDTGIKGIDRFVKRIHAMFTSNVNKKVDQPDVLAALHRTIKKVTEDIEALRFNTAISALMELLNLLEQEGGVSSETAKTFMLLLAPLAPHLSEELWQSLGGNDFVIRQKWPVFDPALIQTSTFVVAIQVNGKLRGEIEVDVGATKEEVLTKAKAHPNVQKFLTGGVKKEIYVQGKLVSLVV
ncbi:MAG: class I tRNA ligase family protein [Candidatus Peribacteraceae bacterium]|jgi:leucyl-tRNA synthetase|nr:class I tRNA ligase family protein [Candidatus Peribacteraceae bacterium]